MKLAYMQGRLSPMEDGRIQCFPVLQWREEFQRAVEAGIPAIEWIDDTYGATTNPLRTDDGIQELKQLMQKHNITIPSVCADTFMEEPLIRCTETQRTERIALLRFLLGQTQKIGARHIGIPLLDNSAIQTDAEMKQVVDALTQVLPDLERLSLELHLETSLDPDTFRQLLTLLDHPRIRVTYDTGNSAALGYDPRIEFAAYGSRIGSVHIKDRIKGGTTVKLGTGDTDFACVAVELSAINFDGLYTLQAAREDDRDEVSLLKEYREFAKQWTRDI
ncbi:MAG: sugar phosphate isomerase/epimerase [Candidatus Peregrinibacteria bacterium]|nr:sugar phosphate isomerase/epimerase [Candidatus Peregrinibacteria bacterium]MCB9807992.1 sugar phosphate isomerase/epimerase [Candidatus Peribacteria bacterium]